MQPAAQYLRMSTDMQPQSLEVQAAAIAAYAAANRLEVVRTYLDAGRSGLTLKGRPELQRLLADVRTPNIGFDVVLVYDVSRWGRFQEVDEAAHCEQICRNAGKPVVYCAEPFEGGSPVVTAVMKAVRRAMAAEYSRDLSEKTAQGQVRTASKGRWTGGPAPFGYERWAVDPQTGDTRPLRKGQLAAQTDYTILRPGPPEAVLTVQRLFRLFVEHGRTRIDVARTLNAEGLSGSEGRPWTHSSVGRLLVSEVYIGTLVTQRYIQRLGQAARPRPPIEWARKHRAFEPIIGAATFAAAQDIIAGQRPNARKWTDDEMIEGLVAHQAGGGDMSCRGVELNRSLPWPRAYLRRFGSMGGALALAGVPQSVGQHAADARAALRRRRAEFRSELALDLHSRGHQVSISRGVLTLDGWLDVTFAANGPRLHHGRTVWEFKRPKDTSRLLVAARLQSLEGGILDIVVFDARVMTSKNFRLGPHSAPWRAETKLNSIEAVGRVLHARLNS